MVDWATLVSRRADATLWDVYITHSPFLPEPMLSPPQLGEDAPGWWKTPAKDAALAAFNGETDPGKRAALWAKVQEVVYEEVPYVRVGNFASLSRPVGQAEGLYAKTLARVLERRAGSIKRHGMRWRAPLGLSRRQGYRV